MYICSKTKQNSDNNLLPQKAGAVTGDPDSNVVVCVIGNFDGDDSIKSKENADTNIVGSVVRVLDNNLKSSHL